MLARCHIFRQHTAKTTHLSADHIICLCYVIILCKQLLTAIDKRETRPLSLVRVYRDLAESSLEQKRSMKTDLERKIELVRDFWRNKIVEGTTRSGKILQASLMKNS